MSINKPYLECVNELKDYIKKKCGVEISQEEAEESADNLVSLVEVIIRFNAQKRHQFCRSACPILSVVTFDGK